MKCSTNRIWPQVTRLLGEVGDREYKCAVFDDGSIEYWFDLTDPELDEENIPTIPDQRELVA